MLDLSGNFNSAFNDFLSSRYNVRVTLMKETFEHKEVADLVKDSSTRKFYTFLEPAIVFHP